MKIICLDLESGGPSKEYSLLTACFKIYSGNSLADCVETDKLSLSFKHEIYKISPEGMKVNGLDLNLLDSTGISLSKGGELLYKFLQKNYSDERLIPLGHAVKGDLSIVFDCLLKETNWEKFVSNLYLDTLVEAKSLQVRGLIPMKQSLKLGDICSFFGISGFNFHSAEGDVDATWALYKKLGELRSGSL